VVWLHAAVIAGLLVFVCAFFRIVPHPPNVAPVGATAVLAGRTMRWWTAIAVTLAAMALSDLALAAIHGWAPFSGETIFVYAGFTAQIAIARALRRFRGGAIAAALFGAIAFFAISNLGLWALGMYPRTGAGLLACYTAALPFLERSVVGDLAWTVALVLVWRTLTTRAADDRVPAL
jgi:hypothetical protein